jgi:hypothetical protein
MTTMITIDGNEMTMEVAAVEGSWTERANAMMRAFADAPLGTMIRHHIGLFPSADGGEPAYLVITEIGETRHVLYLHEAWDTIQMLSWLTHGLIGNVCCLERERKNNGHGWYPIKGASKAGRKHRKVVN